MGLARFGMFGEDGDFGGDANLFSVSQFDASYPCVAAFDDSGHNR